MGDDVTTAALWWAVIASGLYHGLNPGMGWPLAVSAALMERRASAGRSSALARAIGALGVGHFAAMLLVLAPFAIVSTLVLWEREIQVVSAVVVISLGVYLLVDPRHPRFLARVSPTKLSLWSFLSALAHGAALMLLPIFLGLCAVDADDGHRAAFTLVFANAETALLVAGAHTLAMTAAGGAFAVATYVIFGLRVLSKAWFNLDTVWAASLVVVGLSALWLAGH